LVLVELGGVVELGGDAVGGAGAYGGADEVEEAFEAVGIGGGGHRRGWVPGRTRRRGGGSEAAEGARNSPPLGGATGGRDAAARSVAHVVLVVAQLDFGKVAEVVVREVVLADVVDGLVEGGGELAEVLLIEEDLVLLIAPLVH